MIPKIIARRVISFTSYFWGDKSSSGATVSLAIITIGKSDKRLSNRICTGNIGKKGTNNEAVATAKKLPKLEARVALIYFVVLAKTRRPYSIPSKMTFKFLLTRIISAASRAISAALFTTKETPAIFRAGASLIPSPKNPTAQ